ncbi:Dehydrogenases (flavoproteins) [Granulibacter bethesdensis]|uniref:Dehydrogenases (Flavoproteins) n=1 Tax=Granulibacter bethesdensis TaxID=364410 RepID=A0AAN0VGU9_9PROT|nr:NAD(P)/FAD-dependent oxidoreductase [Granulibacter bethesdensis]AHJ64336.1 Dehydrogenases (flavoproteins) [Granulibacter bethesdensis]
MLDSASISMKTGGSTSDARLCDVLIVGAGPAGCTAACLLAEKERDVVLLEKDRHPRFHIGESLLPRNLQLIERLGLTEDIATFGVFKPGAEFISDDHGGQDTKFCFADALDKTFTHSWQVKRADFDAALFRRARDKGADAIDGMRVTTIRFPEGVPEGSARAIVEAVDEAGNAHHFAPRYVIDASGRDTFLGSKVGGKKRNPHNNTAALYAHFRHVTPRPCDRTGYITICLVEGGWFWMIPLPDDITSVGFVGTQEAFKQRKGSLEDFLDTRIAASPSVSSRMMQAERISKATATGNYSYSCERLSGPGWMMIGDAFAFLDPVFSSGVLLAMTSGEMGAEVADLWLDNPAAARKKLKKVEAKIRHAIGTLSWLVYRINKPVLRDMFMSPNNRFRMRDGLVSLLAGNVHGTLPRNPVRAFKGAYYFLTTLAKIGIRLTPDGDLKRGPRID